ncbi:MAG: hypothetical protein MUP48_05110 [Wolbachia endosymbiont of Homalodisca vitripennis]|nr:hypothetical protein [Wolbachia endosymbiont of Homalodisca vitripennis]MCJ7454802.1 hypothetical protein [Wolbachia endosymbiont of Homalodisca vitripennis]MCJ7475708.1 hypothetical protein [Wolbachia endosymbiont of Homalodisca vitripennis]
MHNANETLIMNFDQVPQLTPKIYKLGTPYNNRTRIYEYITLAKALENLNDPSRSHANKELFLSDNDEETKKFLSVIRKGIAEYTGNDSVDVRLRGKEDKSFTAWVSLKEGRGESKFDNSFPGKALKDSNPKIKAFTLVSPEDKRLVRVSQSDDGVRLYQILNDSCIIKFNWKVGDRDCSIALNISGNGNVFCTDLSDNISPEDFEENKAVKIKIGYYENKKMDKYNDMTLAKLVSLASNLQGIEREVITINPSTGVTSASAQNVSESQHSQNIK